MKVLIEDLSRKKLIIAASDDSHIKVLQAAKLKVIVNPVGMKGDEGSKGDKGEKGRCGKDLRE